MGLIIAPSCLHFMGSDYDIAIFIDANEEEEKKGNESVKNIEFRIAEMAFKASVLDSGLNEGIFGHQLVIYSTLYSEVISPPPERCS